MRKAHPQKNTLLKAAKANAATKAFKRVFFSPTQEEFFPPLFFLFFFRHRTGFVRNQTDSASYVNRFVESVCKLDTTQPRIDSKPAGNKGLNESGGAVLRWTIFAYLNCGAS